MVAKSRGIICIVTLPQLHRIVALDSKHVMLRTYMEKVMRGLTSSTLSMIGHLHSIFILPTSFHFGSLGDGKMLSKAGVIGNVFEEIFWLRETVFIPALIQPKLLQSSHDTARFVALSRISFYFFPWSTPKMLTYYNTWYVPGAALGYWGRGGNEQDKHKR